MAPGRIDSLDGVRGLACLLVFYAHLSGMHWLKPYGVPLSTGQGAEGVILFFILSGFLMAYHYLPGERSARYWAAFLLRRFFRIWPAYTCIVILVCVLSYIVNVPQLSEITWMRVAKHMLLIDGWGYSFWTVPIEVLFYCLLPIAGWLLLPLPVAASITVMLASWLAITLAYPDPPVLGNPIFAYMGLFCGGVASGMAFRCYAGRLKHYTHFWNIALLGCFLLLFLVFIPRFSDFLMLYGNWWNRVLYISGFFMFFLLCVSLASPIFSRPLNNRCMRFMGQISYSFYLIHRLILWLVERYVPAAPWLLALLACILTTACAWLLYRTIERPGIALGRKLL